MTITEATEALRRAFPGVDIGSPYLTHKEITSVVNALRWLEGPPELVRLWYAYAQVASLLGNTVGQVFELQERVGWTPSEGIPDLGPDQKGRIVEYVNGMLAKGELRLVREGD